jgi:hypothetical protein
MQFEINGDTPQQAQEKALAFITLCSEVRATKKGRNCSAKPGA